MLTSTESPNGDIKVVPTGVATGLIEVEDRSPVRVFGVASIRDSFGQETLRQAYYSRLAPGVDDLVLNPDAHVGYGAPVGCVLVSPTHIYPGPVGVDINCSTSLLQLELDAKAIADKNLRRALIDAIERRIPTGLGSRQAPQGRKLSQKTIERALVEGATPEICDEFGVPRAWIDRLEDAGRALSRTEAQEQLDQSAVEAELAAADVLTNQEVYPKDEAPSAYKNFDEVLRSVELAGLAREVARMKAAFVIKDAGEH